jgi:hypothetical protein
MRIGLFLNNLDEEYQRSVYSGVQAQAKELGIDSHLYTKRKCKHRLPVYLA